jgi:hypothetical protein
VNEGRRISIAGLEVEIRSRPNGLPFRLAPSFASFHSEALECDLEILVDLVSSLNRLECRPLYECSIWSNYLVAEALVYETYHPPSGRILARAVSDRDLRRYDLSFNEETAVWLSHQFNLPSRREVAIAYPLDQLLFIPVLARRDVVLMHACGVVLDGKAMVFAGHSGDGKTTLSRMFEREGCELLSDERIAIRKSNSGYVAYGTPWPGEGNVVSSAAHPLGGVFVLRKSNSHRLIRCREKSPSNLVSELISRSIVPYYLREETSRILALISGMVSSLPVAELEFCLEPGLPWLLRDL